MDSNAKITALTEILAADPANAFARYGLAMERIGQGDTDAALTEFTTLIGHNPDYVPAYQMSAQTLAKLGRTDEALSRLHTGIATANRIGNQHALAEMEALRDELGI
jgi:predicted Zn-dependent protease